MREEFNHFILRHDSDNVSALQISLHQTEAQHFFILDLELDLSRYLGQRSREFFYLIFQRTKGPCNELLLQKVN